MPKIVSLTKDGVRKLITAAGAYSPTPNKAAMYDSRGCVTTANPSFGTDCVNKKYLDTRLAGLGAGGGGTSTPTANAVVAYDSNARLRSTPKPEGANSIEYNEVVTFGDLVNPRVNDAYGHLQELKATITPFRVKLTSADPTTGGRVHLPIPGSQFPWITRTTGAGGGYEYEMREGQAYQIFMNVYGKAYFRSYNLFEDGTGFWNLLSPTGENWKSDSAIIWRKNGKPNVWLEHNGWQTGPGRMAVLIILPLFDVFI